MLEGWKILTRQHRLPAPGSPRVWDGRHDAVLKPIEQESSVGVLFHLTLVDAFRLSGLWPMGWPSVAVRVSASALTGVSECERMFFSPAVRVVAQASEAEIMEVFNESGSVSLAGPGELAAEQRRWRLSLSRPSRAALRVQRHLQNALAHRGLAHWSLREFSDARDVWTAWKEFAARSPAEAEAAREDFGIRTAFAARKALMAENLLPSWRAWDPWTTPDGEYRPDASTEAFNRDLCAARASYSAHFGLTVYLASLYGLVHTASDHLTLGLRDAYTDGLEIAFPIDASTLGWAMAGL